MSGAAKQARKRYDKEVAPLLTALRELDSSSDSSFLHAVTEHCRSIVESIAWDIDCGNYLEPEICYKDMVREHLVRELNEGQRTIEEILLHCALKKVTARSQNQE